MKYANKNPPQHFNSLCGCILTQVHDTQYLGITISSELRWQRCFATTAAKANRIIGLLRRNLSVKYSDPHLAKDTQLFETVQRKAARFVLNNYKPAATVTDMMNKLGCVSLEYRCGKTRPNLMNKIVGGNTIKGVHHKRQHKDEVS